MKNNVINKGNYSMETLDRELLFETFKAEGWEEDYLAYRKKWCEQPEQRFVSEYPLLVDLELSSVCNLRCPMCYTISEEFKRRVNAKLMPVDLFKKVIDEIGGKVPALRVSLRGEPTLHPQLVECILYAKKKGLNEVSFLTNGSRLTKDFFIRLLEAGTDWITISIDGLGENYENIRKPLIFIDTLRKIKDIKAVKDEYGVRKPVIKIQSVWPAIREGPETYYNIFAPYVDFIAFNPLIDFVNRDQGIVFVDDFCCPQHYQRLVVGADGLVMMCANDEENEAPVGDAKTQSIHEIWHGESLNEKRCIHQSKDGFKGIPVCKNCYLPCAVEDSETAVVNGRTFAIQNYVVGKQAIEE